jgi:presequence protease
MQENVPIGTTMAGFSVDSITEIPELNLTQWQLTHSATGARYVHLATADPNNLFAINFRTPPSDSTGVAHILEHTVLCGSERFPVRDPFFSMLKRSLNTFMNAMTANDWTSYPFASQNRKDFYNLMEIYLDATFFPLLRKQDFLQEGHRLEPKDLTDPRSGLHYQGVVYNEMKGAMASPSSLLSRRLCRALYPTTTYRHNSGGEPAHIPDLSWEQLRAFHADFYHPGNCWFFSYGDLPLQKHLETVDRQVMARYAAAGRPKSQRQSEVPPEQRFAIPRWVEETFPIDPGSESSGKTMVQLAWLTNDISDSYQRLALNLLGTLLLGNPAAPLYRALIESRLGSNLAPGIGYHDDNRTTYFAVGLQGTEADQSTAIETLILDTLQQIAAAGFPAQRVAGALHRLEFSNREVTGDSYPYPLVLLMRMLGPWLHADDPLSPLQLDRHLDQLKQNVADPAYLPGLIRTQLLDNPHRVTLVLRPDPEQSQREAVALAARLKVTAAALSAKQLQALVVQAETLKKSQDAEEDLSCLPTLTRADIPVDESEVIGEAVDQTQNQHFRQPTNGITYVTAQICSDPLANEDIPYLPLLGALLSQIGAAGRSYLDMAERIEAETGGIHGGCEILEHPDNSARFISSLVIKGKALNHKADKLFEILTDLCTAPDFTNLERLHTVLNQLRTSLENSISGSGHSYAARAAAAQLSASASRREIWSGFSQIALIKTLAKKNPDQLRETSERLQRMARQLFTRTNVTCAVTSDSSDQNAEFTQLNAFLTSLPSSPVPKRPAASFNPTNRPLGFSYSVPVSYVTRVFPAVSFTHPDAAPLSVLAKLLRAGFLHREIREKGGAYGGMAGYNPEAGLFSLLSYRDPQLERTLAVYEQALAWAVAGKYSDQEVEEAVLAVFADLDRPLSPSGRATREFSNQLQDLTREMRSEYRQRVLRTERKDLMRVAATYLLNATGAIAVLSNRETLAKANEKLPVPLQVTAIE